MERGGECGNLRDPSGSLLGELASSLRLEGRSGKCKSENKTLATDRGQNF